MSHVRPTKRGLLVEHPDASIPEIDAFCAELDLVLVRAATAADAAERARGAAFLLVLAAVPGDGAGAPELVRELAALDLPVIVLAPQAGPEFPLERCYDAGAADVIAGPVAPFVLRAKTRFLAHAAHAASERRQALDALQDTRVRLDTTVTHGDLALWNWDMKNDRVTGDATMQFLFNVTPEQAAGGPVSAYYAAMHPDDAAQDAINIRRAVDTGAAYESRARVKAKDGQYHLLLSRGQVLYDAEGKPESLRGVVRDITSETQAQADLRESEERYRTLFEAIDEAVCIIEMIYDEAGEPVDYRFLETNKAFEQHTGLVGAPGNTVLELVPGHDRHWMKLYGEVARTGVPVRHENEVGVMNRWFDVYATRVGPAGSNKVAVLFTDISERKRAEIELQRLADDLKDADRRKTEFLATLAHELRNPLAPLRSGLQVLRLSQGDAQAIARVSEVMERQLGHMVDLVDDLLDVARITRGQVELKHAHIDLKDVLDLAVETAMPAIDDRHHTLDVRPAGEPLPLFADATRLIQVVNNLLNNAAKYTPHGGTVTLATRREKDEAVLTVSDNGVGIAPDALDEVFGMFNQVGRSTDRTHGGLGIGLSLVRSMVDLHGGSVSAASAGPGLGSTFTVRLPLAVAAAPAEEPAPAPPAAVHKVRVLVVDDNRDAADTLSALLDLLGHNAQVANDGRAALDAMQDFRPQVVFLDIGMPGMNGYEVAEAIRNDRRFDQPLLVALTGWGGEDDRQRTSAAGFDLHLTKPVDLGEIEKMLAGV